MFIQSLKSFAARVECVTALAGRSPVKLTAVHESIANTLGYHTWAALQSQPDSKLESEFRSLLERGLPAAASRMLNPLWPGATPDETDVVVQLLAEALTFHQDPDTVRACIRLQLQMERNWKLPRLPIYVFAVPPTPRGPAVVLSLAASVERPGQRLANLHNADDEHRLLTDTLPACATLGTPTLTVYPSSEPVQISAQRLARVAAAYRASTMRGVLMVVTVPEIARVIERHRALGVLSYPYPHAARMPVRRFMVKGIALG